MIKWHLKKYGMVVALLIFSVTTISSTAFSQTSGSQTAESADTTESTDSTESTESIELAEDDATKNFSKQFQLRLDPIRKPLNEIRIEDKSSTPFSGFGGQTGLSIQGDVETSHPTSIFLRGLGTDRFVLMWNGFKLNDDTTTSGSFALSEVLREFSSEKQILKGAQTLMYGSQAMGGVMVMNQDTADQELMRLWVAEDGTASQLSKVFTTDTQSLGIGHSQFKSGGDSTLGDRERGEADGREIHSFTGFYEFAPASDRSLKFWLHQRATRSEDDIFPVDDPDAYSRSSESRQAVDGRWGPVASDHWRMRLEAGQIERQGLNPDSGGELFLYDELITEQKQLVLVANQWRRANWQFYTQAEWQTQKFELSDFGVSQLQESLNTGAAVVGGTFSQSASTWGFGVRGDCLESHCEPLVHLSQEFLEPNGHMSSMTFAQGLKHPTFYQLHSIYGSQDLAAEKSWSIELSRQGPVRAWGLERSGATWGANLFHTELSQMIDFDLGLYRYENLQRVVIDGLEMDAKLPFAPPNSQWTYEIQTTLMRAYDLSSREPLPRRPSVQLEQALSWHKSANSDWILSSHYLGSRKDQGQTLAEKWLWDLRFEYEVAENIFEAGVKNLTNSSLEEISGYNSGGRRLWAGIRIQNW